MTRANKKKSKIKHELYVIICCSSNSSKHTSGMVPAANKFITKTLRHSLCDYSSQNTASLIAFFREITRKLNYYVFFRQPFCAY